MTIKQSAMENSVSNNTKRKKSSEQQQKASVLSITQLEILRKAYEIIMENSDHCFGITDISLLVKRENDECVPMI
jgi:hypothetical protein